MPRYAGINRLHQPLNGFLRSIFRRQRTQQILHEDLPRLEKSMTFYAEALGLKEVRRKEAPDGSWKLVYLGDGESDFTLELTWLRDREAPYSLGENDASPPEGSLEPCGYRVVFSTQKRKENQISLPFLIFLFSTIITTMFWIWRKA